MGGYYNPYASGFSAAHMAAAPPPQLPSSPDRWGFPHCKENPIFVFPGKELSGLSPNFHSHVSVGDLYIPPIGPPILLQQNRQTDRGII